MTKSTSKPIKTARYLSIPYKFNGDTFAGCDCYGLISLVLREELGIEIAQFKMYDSYRDVDEGVFVEHSEDEFTPVAENEIQPFDVLLVYTDRASPTHVGIYIGNGRFLHITRHTRRAIVEKVSIWRDKLYAVYRHKELA